MTKKFFVTFFAILLLNISTCAAEDLKFINSNDEYGYFVDIDTFKTVSPTIFDINMIIIRLNLNQMDVVDLQINHGEKNYTVRSTRTLSYDERTEIKFDNTPRIAKGYSDKSLMGDIVRIVIYGGE